MNNFYQNILKTLLDGEILAVARRLPDGREITERFIPKPRLIVLGGGHIAVPLVKIAAIADFSIMVYDDRPFFANQPRFPEADNVICDSFSKLSAHIKITGNDYVTVLTRGHRYDQDCLRTILNDSPGRFPKYLGMIGSRRRVAVVLKQLEFEGYPSDKLLQIHAPIGLSIHAATPGEIAISIAAELVQTKRAASKSADVYADMEILQCLATNTEPAALITITETEGSVPREAGAKMIVFENGQTIGSIGGGCVESDIVRKALSTIGSGACSQEKIDLSDPAEEDGMVCGGCMTVLIEDLCSTN